GGGPEEAGGKPVGLRSGRARGRAGGPGPRRRRLVGVLQDRARIYVQAGAGGNGSVSFRREAHVPRGGPDGGDGGRGADVVLVCDGSRRDLEALRRAPHLRAGRGGRGRGSNRHGGRGEDRVVPVPPGTQV